MALLSIDNVLVERDVLLAFFSCDLHECRGMCCVEGELGAPLAAAEALQLQDLPEELLRMLPEKNREYLYEHPPVEVYQGVQYTKSIDGRECVFTAVRDGITFCALESAFQEGILAFQKPLSCRLFPIRVRKMFGLDYLVYEQHGMCLSARKAGEERQIQLIDCVHQALEALYGLDWIMSLKAFLDSTPIR